MTRLFLAFAVALTAYAQVQITVSQQGAEVLRAVSGRLVPGVGVAAVSVCSNSDATQLIPSERIYQQIELMGVSTISPVLAGPLLDRQRNRSSTSLVMDGMAETAGIVGVIRQSTGARPRAGWTLALALAPIAREFAKARSARNQGNDTSTRANLLTGGDIGIAPRKCADPKLILYRYRPIGGGKGPDWEPKVGIWIP